MREVSIEMALVERVKTLGGVALKLPSVFVKGLPDRMILLPGARIVFVETKAPGKTMSPMQVRWQQKLVDLGFDHRVIDSMEVARAFA